MSALKEHYERLKSLIEQRRSIIYIQTDDCQSEVERIKDIFKELNIKKEGFKKDNINIWLPDGGGKRRLYGGSVQGDGLCNSLRSLPLQENESKNENEIDTTCPNCGHTYSLQENRSFPDSFKSILIVRDLHYCFESNTDDSPQVASLLEEFYYSNEKREREERSIVIIVSPKFEIPIDLKNCVYTVTPPYPDETDIEEELGLLDSIDEIKLKLDEQGVYKVPNKSYVFLDSFFHGRRGDVYVSNKKKLLAALKGLRIHEIQTLLSYNVPSYTIAGVDINDFRESKKRMVQDSGLLRVEHFQDQEKYDDYVGDIEGLKQYMRKEKGVIDNRGFYNKKMPLPKGILLVGPPGCGKSETSKAIASILDMPLYSMDMGRLLGGLMGQSEHNFERALSIAEAAQPCVLRIDEIEKAFAGSGSNENDQTMTHIVGHFLTWMQERKSLVYLVATANNLEMLRPEFLRKGRWDEIFYLTYPSSEGMKKIVVSCLKKYGLKMEDWENDADNKVLGNRTKEIIDYFYEQNPSIKVSGAEIVDMIEQIYKSQFVDLQNSKNKKSNTEDKTEIIEKAKILSVNSFNRKLDSLSKKQRDVEISKAIDRDILDIEINQLLKNKSEDKQLESEIRKIIETKYNDEAIKGMIESELDSLEISKMMSESNTQFNRGNIEPILKKEVQQREINTRGNCKNKAVPTSAR